MANKALDDYVKENLSNGVSPAALREELEKTGWKKGEIEDALSAKPSKAPAPERLPLVQEKLFATIQKIPMVYLVLLVLLTLAVLGVAAYYAYSFLAASSQSVAAMIVGNDTLAVEGTPTPISPSLPPESTPAVPPKRSTPTPFVIITPPPTPFPTQPPAKDAPQISDISNFSITSSSVAVSWFTDIPGTTRVIYGITSLNESVTYNDSTTSHRASLTGLVANTTYSYAVASCAGTKCRYSETNSFATLPFTLYAAGVERIDIAPRNPKIFINQSAQFYLSVVYKSGARTNLSSGIMAWNSSNTSVGGVNATGAFHPGATGTTKVGGRLVNATVQGADVKDFWNYTEITVEKAQPKLSISLTPSDLVDYGVTTTASCTASTTQITPTISRDGTALGRTSDSAILAVGSHSYSCSVGETANYTSAGASTSVLVKRIPAKTKLLINGSEWTADKTIYISQGFYYANFSYSAATGSSTDSECQFNTFCKIFTTGAFTFVAYNAGNENYSANTVTRHLNVMP